jgi:ubiquinone/menaquinone biosynthesis C-methylase UbiE
MTEERDYITGLALGYQVSQVLFAALHLRIFTLLEKGAGYPEELARRSEADGSAVSRLLTALVALKLVEEQDGCYHNTEIASRCLAEGGAEYCGKFIRHASNLWPFWEDLDQRVKCGKAKSPAPEYLEEYPRRLRDYLAAMDESAAAKAAAIADAIGIGGFRRMLDVGCGPGGYGIAFSRLNPNLSVALIDMEPSLATARTHVREAGLQDRIDCHVCQILEDPVPGDGYDLVFLSNLIHIYSDREVELIVNKVWQVLDAPGELVIHDYLLNTDGRDQLHAALFNLAMLVGTPRGKCYRVSELADMLSRLGAAELRVKPVGLGTSLIVAKKTDAPAG